MLLIYHFVLKVTTNS